MQQSAVSHHHLVMSWDMQWQDLLPTSEAQNTNENKTLKVPTSPATVFAYAELAMKYSPWHHLSWTSFSGKNQQIFVNFGIWSSL